VPAFIPLTNFTNFASAVPGPFDYFVGYTGSGTPHEFKSTVSDLTGTIYSAFSTRSVSPSDLSVGGPSWDGSHTLTVGQIGSANGSVSTPLVKFGVSPTIASINLNNNQLLFNTNTTTRAAITTGGFVGIGTTTPQYLLDVRGVATASYFQSVSSNASTSRLAGASLEWNRNNSDGVVWFLNQPGTGNGGWNFSHVNSANQITSTSMFVASGGSVGIGTTNPNANLTVVGDISASNNITASGQISANSLGLNTTIALNPTNNSFINTSYNVGIGTNNPTYKLDVQQNSSSASASIRAYNANSSNTSNAGLFVQNATGANGILQASGNKILLGAQSGTAPVNIVNNGYTAITVLSNGNVGIGTTSSAYPLQVAGAVLVDSLSSSSTIAAPTFIGNFYSNGLLLTPGGGGTGSALLSTGGLVTGQITSSVITSTGFISAVDTPASRSPLKIDSPLGGTTDAAYVAFSRAAVSGGKSVAIGIEVDNTFRIGGGSLYPNQSYKLWHDGNTPQIVTGNSNSPANLLATDINGYVGVTTLSANNLLVTGSITGTTSNATNAAAAASVNGGYNNGNITFNYSTQSGTPNYVYGSTSNNNVLNAYNPSNFSVLSAGTSYTSTSALSAVVSNSSQALIDAGTAGNTLTFSSPWQSGQPNYFWGSATSGGSSTLYRVSSLNVASATTASNATNATNSTNASRLYDGGLNTNNAMTFSWAQAAPIAPVGLWGSTDGINMRYYTPASLSAGSAYFATTVAANAITDSNIATGASINVNKLSYIPVQQSGAGSVVIGLSSNSTTSVLALTANGTTYGSVWPISVSGAGSATNATKANQLAQNGTGTGMTFNYNSTNNTTGQPSWVWGTNDGVNVSAWNPSNFSVSVASSANAVAIGSVTPAGLSTGAPYWNSTGVGIGTNNAGYKLDVQGGNISFQNAGNGANSEVDILLGSQVAGVSSGYIYGNNYGMGFYSAAAGGTQLNISRTTNDGPRVYINYGTGPGANFTVNGNYNINVIYANSSGKVGIGTNSLSNSILTINGSLSSNSTTGIYSNNLLLKGDGTHAYITPSNSGGNLYLGPNGINAINVNNNGNVGINLAGTAFPNPGFALDINGNINVRTSNVYVGGNGSLYGDASNLALRPAVGATYFQSNTGSSTTMYVDSNTNKRVGINTTSPGADLTVNGQISANNTITAQTFVGNLQGSATSVTNGVLTTNLYSDPTWITALTGSKITGGISGQAGSVANGVYTNGSYGNPSWITSLDASKISAGGTINLGSGTLNAGATNLGNGSLTAGVINCSVVNPAAGNTSLTVVGNISATGSIIAGSSFNHQTASYTLSPTDIGGIVGVDSGSALTVTVPNTITRIGYRVSIIRLGTGPVTISAGSGVTINKAYGLTTLAAQYSAATLLYTGPGKGWILFGDLG
jgi:hypothetical protein